MVYWLFNNLGIQGNDALTFAHFKDVTFGRKLVIMTCNKHD